MPRQPFDKKTCGQIWRAYQERAPPQNLGAIEWPQAKPGRLTGIKFLSTGVFETIEREDLYEIIKSSGGRVYSGFSKNLDYLLVGRDAGPAKLADAEEHNVTKLNEEEIYAFLVEKLSGEGNEETAESQEKKVPVKKESKSKQSKAVAKRKNDPNAADSEPEKKVSKASTSKPSAPKKKAAVAKSNVAVKQKPDNLNNGAHDGSSVSEGEEAAEDSSKKEIVFRDVEIRLKLTEIPTGGRLGQESKKMTKVAAPKIKGEPIDDSDVTERGDLTIQDVKQKKGRPKKTLASKVKEEPTDEPNLAVQSTKGKRGRPKMAALAIKTESEEGSEQNVPSRKTKASKEKGTDSSKSTKTVGGSHFSPRKTRSKTAK